MEIKFNIWQLPDLPCIFRHVAFALLFSFRDSYSCNTHREYFTILS